VVPSRWEQHITPDIENKWKAKPYSYLPDYVKYPGVVTEALIKNQHLPKKVSESDQARKYREMKANKPSAITVNDGIKLIMPPKKNTKKTKKKKKSFLRKELKLLRQLFSLLFLLGSALVRRSLLFLKFTVVNVTQQSLVLDKVLNLVV